MRDLEADLGLANQPPGDSPAGGQPESWAVRSPDALQVAFESDLSVWLAWLEEMRDARADQGSMRRLELVCATGWTAVTLVTLLLPLVGVTALAFSLALFVMTLVLACVVTAPQPEAPHAASLAADALPEWSSMGPSERARLVRIINLSRVAERPLGARLLLSELDEVLAAEPFASWSPLSELRDIVQAGYAQLVPFGSEPDQGNSQYAFAGHVP